MCVRMLKQWAVLGKDVSSKEDHQQLWPSVLEAAKKDQLLTDVELESRKCLAWAQSSSAPSSAANSVTGKRKRDRL